MECIYFAVALNVLRSSDPQLLAHPPWHVHQGETWPAVKVSHSAVGTLIQLWLTGCHGNPCPPTTGQKFVLSPCATHTVGIKCLTAKILLQYIHFHLLCCIQTWMNFEDFPVIKVYFWWTTEKKTALLQTGKTVPHCCSLLKYTVCISAEVDVDNTITVWAELSLWGIPANLVAPQSQNLRENDPKKPRVSAFDPVSFDFHMLTGG